MNPALRPTRADSTFAGCLIIMFLLAALLWAGLELVEVCQ